MGKEQFTSRPIITFGQVCTIWAVSFAILLIIQNIVNVAQCVITAAFMFLCIYRSPCTYLNLPSNIFIFIVTSSSGEFLYSYLLSTVLTCQFSVLFVVRKLYEVWMFTSTLIKDQCVVCQPQLAQEFNYRHWSNTTERLCLWCYSRQKYWRYWNRKNHADRRVLLS